MKQGNMQPIELSLSYIERVFSLEIANVSQTPVRIWSARFSLGYDAISLRVSARNGNPCLIRRKPTIWTVNIPDFILIQSGHSHIQKLDLNDGTWDFNECSIDLDTEIYISAILEITRDEYTARHDVITGFYESNHLQFKGVRLF